MPFNKFGGGFGGFGGGMNFGGFGGQGYGNGAANQGAAAVNPFLARRSFNFPPQVRRDLSQPSGQQGPGGMYRNLFHKLNRPGVMPQTGADQGAGPMDSFGSAVTQGMRPQQAPRPQFGGYASMPPEGGPSMMTAPDGAAIPQSFGAAPPTRTWTPQEKAQYDWLERRQGMMDRNPNFRDNLAGSMERDRAIVEKGMVPDVNDPNFHGITPQQAFQQIPGNAYNVMRDRFNAMKANRSPNVQDQSAMDGMTASQATSTMPNYQQRLAQAEQQSVQNRPQYRPVDVGGPAYRLNEEMKVVANPRITPMPNSSGELTPQEAARMQAVGSSVGDWKAKSDWMAKNGINEYTPEVAQRYTAEQQQKRLKQNDSAHLQKMARIGQADQIREAKARQSGQLFRRFNPELFETPDLTAAQLYSSLAGGNLQQFQQTGLSPQQQAALDLQNRQFNLERAQMEEDPIRKQQILRSMEMGGAGGAGPYGGYGGSGSSMPPSGMPVRDVAFRQENTTPESAEAMLEYWFKTGHTPSQAELDEAGISPEDINEYKNSQSSSIDWMADNMYGLNFLTGNNSTKERTKRYQWSGALTGEQPTWWDNQFGAGWNPQTQQPQPYTPGSQAESNLARMMEDYMPTAAAVGLSLFPWGRAAKWLRGGRAAQGAAGAAEAIVPSGVGQTPQQLTPQQYNLITRPPLKPRQVPRGQVPPQQSTGLTPRQYQSRGLPYYP